MVDYLVKYINAISVTLLTSLVAIVTFSIGFSAGFDVAHDRSRVEIGRLNAVIRDAVEKLGEIHQHTESALLIDHVDHAGIVGSTPRSPHWPSVRNAYFKLHPHCEFKGCRSTGPFNVHHVIPFHLDPSKELDPTNLITLCVGKENHHLYCGHNGDFQDVNPNVRADCKHGLLPAKGAGLKLRHEAEMNHNRKSSNDK